MPVVAENIQQNIKNLIKDKVNNMSYTGIYAILSDGSLSHYKDISNSWLGAFNIWDELSKRYLNKKASEMMSKEGEIQELWDMVRDESVPKSARIVLASTYDNVLVKKENIQILIDAMETFCENFNAGSLPKQIEILRNIQSENILAVAWNQTSVSYTWYTNRYEECPCCGNPIDDDELPYNINIDSKHWYLFEKYDFLK